MPKWGDETAYISKYALTQGIIICNNGKFNEEGRYYGQPPGWSMADSFASTEAHKTLEEALADAEKRRLKRLVSLKEQVVKLESLEIKVKEDK